MQLLIGDHVGTHVDAPKHFLPGGESIDEQDLNNFFGKAVLLDVSDKEARRPVDLELVQEALDRDGLKVHSGDIVLIRAWRGEWGGDHFHEANGLNIEAARWLREKGMKAVGIDLSSIEFSGDLTRPVHRFLLGEKVPIYEDLANLDSVPVKRFMFAGFPLNLKACTGSPVRAVAFLEVD